MSIEIFHFSFSVDLVNESEKFNTQFKKDVRALSGHIKRGMPELYFSWVPLVVLKNELLAYLKDPERNGKRVYSKQYQNNLVSCLNKLSRLDGVARGLTPEELRVISLWQPVRAAALATIENRPGVVRTFEHCWPKFETWLAINGVLPTDFELPHWKDFRSHLFSLQELKRTTAENYAQALKVAFENIGYEVSQKKPKRSFSPEIEAEIARIRAYATREKKGSILEEVFDGEIKSPVVRLKTWQATEYFIRIYLDFYRSDLKVGDDISRFFNSEKFKHFMQHSLENNLHTRQSMKHYIYTTKAVMKYAREMGLPSFHGIDFEDFKKLDAAMKALTQHLGKFKKESVKDRLLQRPLPSFPEVFVRLKNKVEEEHKRLETEHKEALKTLSGLALENRLRTLGTAYRNLLELVYLLHFGPRSGDMYRVITVREYTDESGRRVPAVLKRTIYGTYHIVYAPPKTLKLDTDRFDPERAPWVNFAFPPMWQKFLENYLEKYRPHIHSNSPLLFPGAEGETSDAGGTPGARSGAAAIRPKRLSRDLLGFELGGNDFRKILITYLVSINLGGMEGAITGHSNGISHSRVAHNNYLQRSPEMIDSISRTFYEIFERILNEQIIRMRGK
jgi:hypothetical protein